MRQLTLLIILFITKIGLSQEKTPNIILMIGDGMGLTQISAGMYANNNSTALEGFEYIGLQKPMPMISSLLILLLVEPQWHQV